MRINYFSDLHLEFGRLNPPSNDADIIVAAGDIGVFRQGVDWLKQIKKPVIYVAGNHEFYSHEYKETLYVLREECVGSRIHFLENDTFIYRGVRFIGCSLWTDVFIEGDATAMALGMAVNDFRKITYNNKPLDQHVFSELHRQSRAWLENELAKPHEGKTIVVTHHPPTDWGWDNSLNKLKKLAYCNHLNELFEQYQIDAWFHGHVHTPADHIIGGSRILCNPRGYVGRKMVDGFDQNRMVEI